MATVYRGSVSGIYQYWTSNDSTPVGATDIVVVSENQTTFSYPAIDSNTIVAWTFSGSSGNILNLGTAGSGANIVSIGSAVVRNVSGPVNSGVGYYGTSDNGALYTAQGSAASLGSNSFTNQITLTAFFDLTILPGVSPGGYQRLIVKGYKNNNWATEPYWGACIEWNNDILYAGVGISTSAPTRRTTSVSPAQVPAGSWGWSTGYHMATYTYDGTISKLYFDGALISTTNHGSAVNILMGQSGDEGPWNFGTNFAETSFIRQGTRCVMYHARAENTVRDADWVKKAWRNANGW